MDKIHDKSITKNLVALSKDLVLEPFLTILMQEDIFSGIDVQYIRAERTEYERNRKVCMDMKRKGPNAFDKFINALFETDQHILARKVLLTEYNLKNGTEFTDYGDIPSGARMETEGGCFSKGASKTTSKGGPIQQPTDEVPYSRSHPPSSKITPQGSSGHHVSSDRYIIESDPRGYMLIINNQVFKDKSMGERTGTHIDCVQLENLFSNIGYVVEVKDNLTYEKMKTALSEFARKPKHKSVDSAVVAILSHGTEGAVCGTDSRTVPVKENLLEIKEIEEMFNSEKCPLLMNKPKLFIMQTCRGGEVDLGVWQSDGPTSDDKYAQYLKTQRRQLCAPTYADIIFAYATIDRYKAFRNTVSGSPFIQSLCKIFKTMALQLHVADMLTLVTNDVANQDMSNKDDPGPVKMLPQKTDTLRKFWYLNPKNVL